MIFILINILILLSVLWAAFAPEILQENLHHDSIEKIHRIFYFIGDVYGSFIGGVVLLLLMNLLFAFLKPDLGWVFMMVWVPVQTAAFISYRLFNPICRGGD